LPNWLNISHICVFFLILNGANKMKIFWYLYEKYTVARHKLTSRSEIY